MADEENQSPKDGDRKKLVAEQLASTEIHLAPTQEHVDTSNAIKLPLDQIPQLGVAFASLPAMFRTITTSVSTPTLLQATDKFGNPLDPSILQSFKDGSGLMGSFRDETKGFGQARLHVVEGNTAKKTSHRYLTIPQCCSWRQRLRKSIKNSILSKSQWMKCSNTCVSATRPI